MGVPLERRLSQSDSNSPLSRRIRNQHGANVLEVDVRSHVTLEHSNLRLALKIVTHEPGSKKARIELNRVLDPEVAELRAVHRSSDARWHDGDTANRPLSREDHITSVQRLRAYLLSEFG